MGQVDYLPVREFVAQGSGVVALGVAPDGLPLLTKVAAPARAEDLLRQAAWALGVESPQPRLDGTPLEPLSKDLETLLRQHSVQRLAVDENTSLEAVMLPRQVSAYSGGTLLSRLFRNSGSLTATELRADTRSRPLSPTLPRFGQTGPTVTVPVPSSPNVPQPKFKAGQLYLALPTDGGPIAIVRRETDLNGWPGYVFVREYVSESLLHLGETFFEASFYDHQTGLEQQESVSSSEAQQYQALRKELHSVDWRWRISRNTLAGSILDIAVALAQEHGKGEIHGDIKFANILLTETGVRLFDSLGLAPGTRAPAMTRGWAAPEQVLGEPVSFQTDYFPIGLMLLELMNGVPFGEEARVLIPVGGQQLEQHQVLRNPGVFIDPATAPVQREAIAPWRAFIEQCIRFNPTDRFSSTEDLINALRPLVEQRTLNGDLEASLSFGRCIYGKDRDGETSPCWLVG